MADIKLKLLRVLEIIKITDKNNPLTTLMISEKLRLFGLEAERKAINRDINILIEAGYDIRLCTDNKRGYYLASREFENWELKVLMDAIVSAKFLTTEDTSQLKDKLIAQSSTEGGQLLSQVTPVNSHIKSANPLIKAMIGQLLEGIRRRKKVRFQYQFTNRNMEKELRKDGYYYVVNPYALTWKDEHYYLICNLDKYDNLAYYRLDRMTNMDITGDPIKEAKTILGDNPGHRIDEYVSTAIYCHTGDKINLRLLCRYGLEDEIIDYFGTGIYHQTLPEGFECHVRVMHSKGLIYWLMQHGKQVKVLSPDAVKHELVDSLKATLTQYEDCNS
ncbi:helix-turn-helix transcriptional regulator [Acetobacterium bakii]|uniref:Uncharacterized protein n=1 Tax=Acetobacterium bakii TaxID=52689 RepID=A0A0L6TZM6_9FIRM|nr:WYL domain-containing protein [Acetobacterium bakii]KNZ41719.1 hypothetical protein AKG39_10335 [Acetobacterium bakii]